MRGFHMTRIILSILSIFAVGFAGTLSQTLSPGTKTCMAINVPIAMLEGGGLTPASNQTSLGAFGVSRWLQVRNETGKSIARVLILVSYLDSEGSPIFTIPF